MPVQYKAQRVRLTDSEAQACTADLYNAMPPLVGFHIVGECPQCDDRTHDLFPIEFLAGPAADSAAGSPPAVITSLRWTGRRVTVTAPAATSATEHSETALQRCRCIENHIGANGKYGCGATWLIQATYDLKNTDRPVTFAAVPEDEAFKAWEGAESRATSAAAALATVRAAAAKWQTALTAILGLVAVVSVVGGRSTIQGIQTLYWYFIGPLAAFAIAANARAIYQANLAAVGFPKFDNIKDLPPLVDSDEGPIKQAGTAVDNLKNALRWATYSLIAAMLAVGLVWFSNGTSGSATLVLNNGKSVCGSISKTILATTPDSIQFQSNGTTKPYPISMIKEIDVGSC
jgi:hypothetical protein